MKIPPRINHEFDDPPRAVGEEIPLDLERWGRNNPPDGKSRWMQLSDGFWTPWHRAQAQLTLARQQVTALQQERDALPDYSVVCEGCMRGLGTSMYGGFGKGEPWHHDGQRRFFCTTEPTKDVVSRAMHTNGVRGVESSFAAEEWRAASQEMHESGNSSWIGVVHIAVGNIRARAEAAEQQVKDLTAQLSETP